MTLYKFLLTTFHHIGVIEMCSKHVWRISLTFRLVHIIAASPFITSVEYILLIQCSSNTILVESGNKFETLEGGVEIFF